MKYIIEIEDTPFARRSSHTGGVERVYRVKDLEGVYLPEIALSVLKEYRGHDDIYKPTGSALRICGQCKALNRSICYASMPPKYKCEYSGRPILETDKCTEGWHDCG